MAVTSWAEPVPVVGSTSAVSFGKLSGRIIRRLKWHRKIFMLSTLLSPPKLHDENNEVGFGREYIREYFLMVMVIKGSFENELFYSASTHAHTPKHSAPLCTNSVSIQIQKQWKHNPRHKMFSSSFNVVSMKQASGHKKGLNEFLFSIL